MRVKARNQGGNPGKVRVGTIKLHTFAAAGSPSPPPWYDPNYDPDPIDPATLIDPSQIRVGETRTYYNEAEGTWLGGCHNDGAEPPSNIYDASRLFDGDWGKPWEEHHWVYNEPDSSTCLNGGAEDERTAKVQTASHSRDGTAGASVRFCVPVPLRCYYVYGANGQSPTQPMEWTLYRDFAGGAGEIIHTMTYDEDELGSAVEEIHLHTPRKRRAVSTRRPARAAALAVAVATAAAVAAAAVAAAAVAAAGRARIRHAGRRDARRSRHPAGYGHHYIAYCNSLTDAAACERYECGLDVEYRRPGRRVRTCFHRFQFCRWRNAIRPVSTVRRRNSRGLQQRRSLCAVRLQRLPARGLPDGPRLPAGRGDADAAAAVAAAARAASALAAAARGAAAAAALLYADRGQLHRGRQLHPRGAGA